MHAATKLCLSWQTFCPAFCRDKRHVLSRQKRVCRDKSNLCHDKCLLQQNFCRDKTSIHLSRQKTCFVTTDVFAVTNTCLSRQNICILLYAESIPLSRQKTCFVETETCLSRQKWNSWHLSPMIAGYDCRWVTGCWPRHLCLHRCQGRRCC